MTEHQAATIIEQIAEVRRGQQRLEALLTGINLITNEVEPERGIIVRMDRLEIADTRRQRYALAAIGAGISSAVAWAWSALTGKS